MKRITLTLTLLVLLGALVLSACGAKTPSPTTVVNIPVVGNQSDPTVLPTEQAVEQTEAYPVESEQPVMTTESPEVTYPVTSTLPQTDDEWRAFITEKLQGHHTLDFLLSQNLSEQQGRDILAKSAHAEVILTAEEEAAMIQWLMAH